MKLVYSGFLALLCCSLAPVAHASDWSSAVYSSGAPRESAHTFAINPVYKNIYDGVDKAKLETLLQQLTGYIPVTVGGKVFSIHERYTEESKAQFRAFWAQYFQGLGIDVQEVAYPTSLRGGGGHNLEAVLPGKSKDSIVVIVHYDSMGPWSHETDNPGVDDDMTGMAISMETARLLVAQRGQLQHTVRFVAADLEEQGGLAGARHYASYIKDLAAKEGFRILAAVDNEQSGWDCAQEGGCGFSGGNPGGPTPVDVFSCSGDGRGYDYKALGDSLAQVAAVYGGMGVTRGCIGENSDHYAMWEIGVPSVVYSEHDPFENPHFDAEGGDTYDKIAKDYYFQIARVGVTFAATLAGLEAR